MTHKTLRYAVKPEGLWEAQEAIREFSALAREREPGLLSYNAYQLRNSFCFLHLMTFADGDAEAGHRASNHLKSCSRFSTRSANRRRYSPI